MERIDREKMMREQEEMTLRIKSQEEINEKNEIKGSVSIRISAGGRKMVAAIQMATNKIFKR